MNTRFNPTANGRLHLGHLYIVLMNFWGARQTGGKLVLRFDDDQPYWLEKLGSSEIAKFCDYILEDLEWSGVFPDVVSYQSTERTSNEVMIDRLGPMSQPRVDGDFLAPSILECDSPYPYTPYFTAAKVVQDHREGIDCLIRGSDLVTEFSLYCYFCERLAIPKPAFHYLPKLLHQGQDLCDVSKTTGQFKIADFRRSGYYPDDVKVILANACLKDPEQGWTLGNVKRSPTMTDDQAPRIALNLFSAAEP